MIVRHIRQERYLRDKCSARDSQAGEVKSAISFFVTAESRKLSYSGRTLLIARSALCSRPFSIWGRYHIGVRKVTTTYAFQPLMYDILSQDRLAHPFHAITYPLLNFSHIVYP